MSVTRAPSLLDSLAVNLQMFMPSAVYHHLFPPQAKNLEIDQKNILITGATSGLGRAALETIAEHRPNKVTILSRDSKSAEEVLQVCRKKCKIKSKGSDQEIFNYRKLDLADLENVKMVAEALAKEGDHYDVIICNAGAMPGKLQHTKQGYEYNFGVNHLGHFALLLTYLNQKKSREHFPSRVVILSSVLHVAVPNGLNFDDIHYQNRPFDVHQAYSEAKLANILFSKALSERLQVIEFPSHKTSEYNNLREPGKRGPGSGDSGLGSSENGSSDQGSQDGSNGSNHGGHTTTSSNADGSGSSGGSCAEGSSRNSETSSDQNSDDGEDEQRSNPERNENQEGINYNAFQARDRSNGKTVLVNAVHPGVCCTELFRDVSLYNKLLVYLLLRSSKNGAQTTLHCAFSTDKEPSEANGSYFENCRKADYNLTSIAQDKRQRDRLWEVSVEMTGVNLEAST